ncbi:DDE-type integrase/transposase/recombinase [Spiroplasma endosymbiont of Lariophagus distinguendus]|uniref:DDE-type integrase/transposase/recombinase n=1 Tax=Spiroplasma endosymbiont of Lariophagus distinguendus TaxID=2935082 RepID=UPI00207AA8E8|nr:DDE-type integrase/transposase/recombinase [Spiroplasma endosymbiont of Lariophagus distinguendus]
MKGFLLMDKIKQIELFIRKLNINQKIKIIDHCKNQYSIRHLSQYLQLNRSTYYFLKNKQKPIKKEINHLDHCNHKYQKLCKFLIEFHSTRKGRIYGYLRIFSAFKEWLKQEKNIHLNIELSTKQMRKIMKDHNIQGLKQTKNNNSKNKKTAHKWIPTMDKVNKNYKITTSSNQIWSMDTKQINTKEGWLYLLVIIDFYSNNVVSYNTASNKSYKDLIKPALEKITQQFSLKQIKSVILHSDNAAEFYCQDISNWTMSISSENFPKIFIKKVNYFGKLNCQIKTNFK